MQTQTECEAYPDRTGSRAYGGKAAARTRYGIYRATGLPKHGAPCFTNGTHRVQPVASSP